MDITSFRFKPYIGALICLAGMGLITANRFGTPKEYLYAKPVVIRSNGIPGYDYAVTERNDLLRMLSHSRDTTDPGLLITMTYAVYFGMAHSEDRRISFTENWLQWVAGHFYSPLSKTQNSELLVTEGVGNCSERSQVLMDICKENGLQSRVIGLNGHSTLEVFFNGQWNVADADYGLVYPCGEKGFSTDKDLQNADSMLQTNQFDSAQRAAYINFWRTTDDNFIMPVNKVANPRLYRFEKVCEWLKWLIPGCMLVLGWLMFRKRP